MALNYIRSLFPLYENHSTCSTLGKFQHLADCRSGHVPLSQLSKSLNVQRAVNKCQLTDCGSACCTNSTNSTHSIVLIASQIDVIVSNLVLKCDAFRRHRLSFAFESQSHRRLYVYVMEIVSKIFACGWHAHVVRARYVQHSR